MNNGIPPDVLKLVERLKGGGVPHEQARALADVISAERTWADARYLPRDDLGHELLPIKASVDKVDAKVDHLGMKIDKSVVEVDAKFDRLEMKIDKSAAEVKFEIMRWTVALWFLQVGFVTALVFKLIA